MYACECPFTLLFVQDVLTHHKESLEEVKLHGHDGTLGGWDGEKETLGSKRGLRLYGGVL